MVPLAFELCEDELRLTDEDELLDDWLLLFLFILLDDWFDFLSLDLVERSTFFWVAFEVDCFFELCFTRLELEVRSLFCWELPDFLR